ncbi:MAG: NAD(+)/NADH kinase, partial [Spirochaetes bacterium]
LRNDAEIGRFRGVNDAVVGVSGISKLVRLSLQLGGYEAGHFRGDGLILSTATGSTAYSMASGGPILVPPMRAVVLTPISPFSLSWRPMVIPDRDEIVISVDEDQRADVLLTVDGQESFPLEEGDVVSITGRAGGVRVIKSDRRVFYEVVRTKLGWSGGPHA